MKQRIRTVVLDDSPICRARLREILESEGDIQVVGESTNGDGVLGLIHRTRPAVLLVDFQMPGIAGPETIERVMANHPLPILVVTGQPEGVRQAAVFESIRRGALMLAEKPAAMDLVAQARLRATVRELSRIPVVRHVAGNLHPKPLKPVSCLPSSRSPGAGPRPLLVGVGASAGGPLAVAAVLGTLPPDYPGAVAVVQHLPVGFTRAFREFLQGRIGLPVRLVRGQTPIDPGVVYLAEDDSHLAITRHQRWVAVKDPPVEGHRPSVDVLFQSLANYGGGKCAGVILSGIGRDGVSGLLAMRRVGALTFAQDQDSCGVYGMPRAAAEAGAAAHILDPKQIASKLTEWALAHEERMRR